MEAGPFYFFDIGIKVMLINFNWGMGISVFTYQKMIQLSDGFPVVLFIEQYLGSLG